MGMDEMECDGIVRRAAFPMGGDRLLANRPADHLEPLLPCFGTLWLMGSLQQETTAEGTAAMLCPKPKFTPGSRPIPTVTCPFASVAGWSPDYA